MYGVFPHNGLRYSADETAYDSDDFPKGPYPDGGGEADGPSYCDDCGKFLENDLTDDGLRSVVEWLADITVMIRSPEVQAIDDQVREFYADVLSD